MSFSAEVKDELARAGGSEPNCDLAELSALVHVAGSLTFRSGRFALHLVTETGATARTVIRLSHSVFDLDTRLMPRKSVLHKTRNYLIVIPEQDVLDDALIEMGIIVPPSRIVSGISPEIVQTTELAQAYLRGAFLAGGFVANPKGDFHLEIAVEGETFARDLVALIARLGVHAGINRRERSIAVYVKNYDGILRLLVAMGATRSADILTGMRQLKSLKNNVNRQVNAEIANQERATSASAEQIDVVRYALDTIGIDNLPETVADFCLARLANPDLSLRQLGVIMNPPASKSALYHRYLRLQQIIEEHDGAQINTSE